MHRCPLPVGGKQWLVNEQRFMIGVFGVYHSDPGAQANVKAMAGTIPTNLCVNALNGNGAAVGLAGHKHGMGSSVAARGSLRVVAIGEIFNGAELTAVETDKAPESLADLLLTLTESNSLERLVSANGLFSAAVYDGQSHRLTLITDRLATYPIHIWRRDSEVVFAGQIITMLADPRIGRKANPEALAQLFTMQRTIGCITPVAGIDALPSGCLWQVDAGRITEKKYWRVTWRQPDFSQKDGAVLLAEALRNTIDRQMAGERNGLLLSGGVDSRLVLAAASQPKLSCWTTASYNENPELGIARQIANMLNAEHHALVVDPKDTLAVLDKTVIESNGMFPASTSTSVFLPPVGEHCSSILTGHGIDYTLRGFYLPSKFIELGGSSTRWPSLRAIPQRPTGGDVLANLRQGPPRETFERIVKQNSRADWWHIQNEAMEETLKPWLESDDPYNAWDAFILHAVSKHYAFTSMMSVRAAGHLRIPAFDNEIFDIYLRMPPAWRCNGRMVQLAMRELSPDIAKMPNANTSFRADLEPRLEVLGLLGRGVLRRLRLARRQVKPSEMHSTGSWQNLGSLMREDRGHRRVLTDIRSRLDSLCFGLMDATALSACIDEHLAGRASHVKLLRQLVTHDAWVRCFGITGVA